MTDYIYIRNTLGEIEEVLIKKNIIRIILSKETKSVWVYFIGYTSTNASSSSYKEYGQDQYDLNNIVIQIGALNE